MIDDEWVADHLAKAGIVQPNIPALLRPYGLDASRARVTNIDWDQHITRGSSARLELSVDSADVTLLYPGHLPINDGWQVHSVVGTDRAFYQDAPAREQRFRKIHNDSPFSLDETFARDAIALAEEAFNGAPSRELEPPAAMTKLALIKENQRLREVIDKADDWRETLNLPQQDLGCEEFNMAWEAYDVVRHGIGDLIPPRLEPEH